MSVSNSERPGRAHDSEAFGHGVGSADPLTDRVLLWTRVSTREETVEVAWTVARDPELSDVVASGRESVDAATDHTLTVDATGLEPGSAYHYAFEALGERSPVGRTRTLPGDPVERLRIGVTSCAKYTAGYFNAYARLADREDLDFVLHLGDYIYEYPNDDGKAPGPEIGRGVEPDRECISLADYRARYAHHRADPDLQRLHLNHPLIATLDDHEMCDDAWRDGAEKHDPERDGPWAQRKAAALRAWQEWVPGRLPEPGERPRIHRRHPLGDLADLLVLDGRTQRDPQVSGPEMDDPDRTLLGEEQRRWLFEELERPGPAWRLLANSVMVGQVYTELMPDELGEPLSELGILTESEYGPDPDQWDGYPAERERLFRQISERGAGPVVFLSGDVHTAWAVELKQQPADEAEAPLAVEFVTPSVTSENLDEETDLAPERAEHGVEDEVRSKNPHVRWVDLDRHGYFVLDLTPDRAQADWWFVDELHRRSDGEEFGAAWLVAADDPGLREADGPAG